MGAAIGRDWAALWLVGVCVCVGCSSPGTPGGSGGDGPAQGGDGGRSASGAAPFAASRAVISGLTHFDRTADGSWEIVLHLELIDRFGDRVKAVGLLSARLFVGATERVSWDLDLSDPERNSAYFDPATGTYRVRLGDLPEAVVAVAAGRGPEPSAVLGVAFATADARGRERSLRDEFRLSPAR